jgi:hypothetical protein
MQESQAGGAGDERSLVSRHSPRVVGRGAGRGRGGADSWESRFFVSDVVADVYM